MQVVTKARLIQHLRLPSADSIREDIERIRQQGTNVSSEGLAHARKLMATERFTSWLSRDESMLQAVDGHCQSLSYGKTSPLSVFCASLASTLSQSSSFVILQYFCGQHIMDTVELPGGPLGLIKSLLRQLLDCPDDVLPGELHLRSDLCDGVDHESVDKLCQIFEIVFSQMNPIRITICLIDGIAEYEGTYRGWADDMCLIAQQLKYMVHHFDGSRTLKVLMTSADKSTIVSSRITAEDQISLRGYGLPNHSGSSLTIGDGELALPPVPSPAGSVHDLQ